MSFPVEAAAARGGLAGGLAKDHPHLNAWLTRVQARPAYQRALNAGGPYSILS
jgi:glutathione S-transferase